jgi:2-haloalkanoic acid dehalogenase type II
MRAIKAISFDLNDTLVDTRGVQEAVVRTCDEVAASAGLDAARLLQANRVAWRAYWPEVEASWTLGVLDGETVSLETWSRALRSCGCDDNALARLARDAHRRHARDVARLFEDVHEVFSWIWGAGLPLALVTNGASDSQRDALRSLGIEQQFAAVIISGEVGIAKPDPRIFAAAINKLGVQPEDVWHVGDSVETDVMGAKAAGLIPVWLNRRGIIWTEDAPAPDHEIRSLRQLIGLVSATI